MRELLLPFDGSDSALRGLVRAASVPVTPVKQLRPAAAAAAPR